MRAPSTIELSGITKRFGAVVALDDVSLRLAPGERLAVVGENGAGKSSLMNVLYGLYQPDAGELRFDGKVVRVRTPADAIGRGVGMVHQHFTLVPTLTVAENVVLGAEPGRFGHFDFEAAVAAVQQTCGRLAFALDPRARVDSLTVGSQQKVEIVKALHRGVSTLVLDEPTAVLTPQEADELFAVTRALSAEGMTVVLISHKLKEVLAFASRVVVMRRGKKVAEVDPRATNAEALAALVVPDTTSTAKTGARGEAPSSPVMVSTSTEAAHEAASTGVPRAPDVPSSASGRTSASGSVSPSTSVSRGAPDAAASSHSAHEAGPSASSPEGAFQAPSASRNAPSGAVGEVRLAVEHLHATGLHDLTFQLRAGELVGLAGVDGNGQSELAEVLTGLRPWTQGTYTLLGERLTHLDPRLARAHGVAHIPEDRLRRALIADLTVEENVALGRQRQAPFARGPWVDFAGRRARTVSLLEAHDVRPRAPGVRGGALSGGNQQKLVVGRELDAAPKVLIAVQPTRGLDLGAVRAVHARLLAQRAAGCAVLLSSLDLDEVLSLADRVLVLYRGKLVAELPRGQFDERVIGAHMLGVRT